MAEVRGAVPSRLESIAALFGPEYLESDPLRYPHRYTVPEDQEVVAFLSALIAFGNVKAIFRSLDSLLPLLGPHPATAIRSWPDTIPNLLKRWRHRWVGGATIHQLLGSLRIIYQTVGSPRALFTSQYDPGSPNIESALISLECGDSLDIDDAVG
ncbi:MAG: DUF2400 family protein [Pseudomonadota bacterium]